MATARFETWLETDMNRLPDVPMLPDDTFAADAGANLVGVRVTKNGEPYPVSGTIRGYVIKPDGTTITVNGSKSENTAYIVLPDSAYTAPGRIMVIIKSLENGNITTLGACHCMMHRALTNTTVG